MRRWLAMLSSLAYVAGAMVAHAQTPQSQTPHSQTPQSQAPQPQSSQAQPADTTPAAKAFANAADIAAAQALLNSARTHEKNREPDKAIADLEKALVLHPKYTAAFIDLAYLHNVKRNFDKAIAALDQAILLDSKQAAPYASRGSAHAGKSNYTAAIADFDKSLALDPKYAYALRNRGSAYVDLKDFERAIVDLDKALELDPKSAFAHTIRGMAYSGKRDYERGIVDFDKAIALDPKSVVAHGSRGNAHYNKLDYDRALVDYNKAIELDPSSPYAYAGRGAVHAAKRRPDQAKIDYRQALALDPNNTFAADGLRRLNQPAAKPAPMPKSPAAAMKVMVVRSASPTCGDQCPEWISAQGDIDDDSAPQFKKVLKAIGSKRLPIFIESGGGSVSAGYEIGRLVRVKGLDVFVAKTEFTCPPNDATCKDGKGKNGQMFGLPQSHLAKCASSCAFVLASGIKRYVGKSSQVGVHQITSFQTHIKVWRTFRADGTILSERKVSEKTVETKTADRTYTNARNFFTEMGINDSIMKLLRDAPANDMHWLSEDELRGTAMATHLINAEQFLRGVTQPTWSDADQQGLVEARRAAALSAAGAKKAIPPTDPADASALTLKIQKELTRLGCSPGKEDGKWGAGVKRALETFTRLASVKLVIEEPTPAILESLEAKRDRVCPSSCPPGQSEANGSCVDGKAANVSPSPATPAPTVAAVTPAAAPAPIKSAPSKKCDPDETLIDGKCVEKPAAAKPAPRQNPTQITAPGADHQCRNFATSCSGSFAYCKRNCAERQAGNRCYSDCDNAIDVCRDTGVWSTTNCRKRNMTR
jgi:tetratricopeptide (TPR) repeat protein